MNLAFDPFRLLVISLAGWLNQRQQDALEYLPEENRVLREQIGGKRLRFNDDQRRRLAVRAKKLGCRILHEVPRLLSQLLCWPGTGDLSQKNMMAASAGPRSSARARRSGVG